MLFHHDDCDYSDFYDPTYWFWPIHLGFLWLGSSGSAATYLPLCFFPWTVSLNIGLNMLRSDSFTSCLDSLLRYFTREFQAMQLAVLLCFVPWINHLPPVCWSTFWKFSLKWKRFSENDMIKDKFSIISIMFLHMPWCLIIWLYFIFPDFIFKSQIVLYFYSALSYSYVLMLTHRHVQYSSHTPIIDSVVIQCLN